MLWSFSRPGNSDKATSNRRSSGSSHLLLDGGSEPRCRCRPSHQNTQSVEILGVGRRILTSDGEEDAVYRSLNLDVIDANGRQSETLETALTHDFSGIDVDVAALEEARSLDTLSGMRQMFESAKISLDSFMLPLDWQADDAKYASSLKRLDSIIEVAQMLGMKVAEAVIRPETTDAFPEAFEQHTTRLGEVAERLAAADIKLGVSFTADDSVSEGSQPFVVDVEKYKALVEAIPGDNVGYMVNTVDWTQGGGEPDGIAALGDKLLSVRLASLDDADTEPVRRLPDVGSVENGKVVAALAAANYQGPVYAWPTASEVPESKTDPAVIRVRESLDSVWVAAGLLEPPPAPQEESEVEDAEASS